MQEQELNNIDYHLLGKYLAGEATPEEAMVVDEWLHLPVNKKQYEELEKIWNGLPGGSKHQLPDGMAAWKELQPGMVNKTRYIPGRWLSIAAAVLVIVIAAVLIFNKPDIEYFTRGQSPAIIRDSLPDGSRVVLNRNSTLRYATSFNTNNRDVSLQGETYFEVKHNPGKPFIIEVGPVKIKVIGTAFNVRQTPNYDTVEVQVQSGLVKMYTNTKELAVAKGQTGVYLKATDEFLLKDSVDANHISYATREFIFYNLSLQQIIPYLEDAYGVTIVARDSNLLPCMLTGRFSEQRFEEILDLIGLTLKFTYTKEGNTYYLHGAGCN
jgi:transmembrane sensor